MIKLFKKLNIPPTIVFIFMVTLSIAAIEFLIVRISPSIRNTLPFIEDNILNAILLCLFITPILLVIMNNPKRKRSLEGHSVRNKVLLAAGVPLIILTVIMSTHIIQRQLETNKIQTLYQVVKLNQTVSKLISSIQNERLQAATNLLNKDTGSENNYFKETDTTLNELAEQILLNDQSIQTKYNHIKESKVLLHSIREDHFKSINKLIQEYSKVINLLIYKINSEPYDFNHYESTITNDNYMLSVQLKEQTSLQQVIMLLPLSKGKFENKINNKKATEDWYREVVNDYDVYRNSIISNFEKEQIKESDIDVSIIKNIKENEFEQVIIDNIANRHLSKLKEILGYNGLIHKFKNYLLRGKVELRLEIDQLYNEAIKTTKALNDFYQGDHVAQYHISNIENTLNHYHEKIEIIQNLKSKKATVETIDKAVYINDTPANQAIYYLENHVWPIDQKKWTDTMNLKIGSISNLELSLINHLNIQIEQIIKDTKQAAFLSALLALALIMFVIILLIVISRNISTTFQQKEEAYEQSKIAEKMKSEFLANMSHEIRTPMNAILGMLGILEKTQLKQDQLHKIKLVNSSSKSLLCIINDILDFSKIDANKLELELIEINIIEIISESIEILSQAVEEKGLDLIVDLTEIDTPHAIGDQTRINQIVSNLISNATKFTETGCITIHAKTTVDSSDNIHLTLSVTDTGIGIPAEKIEDLFSQFTQVDASTTRKYGGTGLGLSIAKRLARMMGGDIHVASKVNEGSTFEFDIVLENDTKNNIDKEFKNTSPRNILISIDNSLVSNNLKKQLDYLGYHTQQKNIINTTNNNNLNTYDLIIIDSQADISSINSEAAIHSNFAVLNSINSHYIQGSNSLNIIGTIIKPVTLFFLNERINHIFSNIDKSHKIQQSEPSLISGYLQNKKILLVEDNAINQEVAIALLESVGLEPNNLEIASNGKLAIEIIKNQSFDLILMDCQMPVMDGYQATAEIRKGQAGQSNIHTPIIAITAHAMSGDKEKCLAFGMDDYLTKPMEPELLSNILKKWLDT